MRRPRFRRSPSSRLSNPEYMMPIPQSPTQISLRGRDTGFPDAFCGSRNTSLPHPEANLNPDACITEDDVNPARALLRYRMSFMAQQEANSRASTFDDRRSDSPEEGTLSAFGRLAINSIRAAEIPGLDAFLPSKDGDGVESSDGLSSRDPDSPVHRGAAFEAPKVDPRDAVRDPRNGRRRSSFINRLMHR